MIPYHERAVFFYKTFREPPFLSQKTGMSEKIF
jgi:hypothetical protein